MKLCFTPTAWDDYLWFQEHDRKLLKRINLLIQDILRSPLEGIGKPEPLKADLAGYWSRRINDEHRLVYSATTTEIIVIACIAKCCALHPLPYQMCYTISRTY